ncbi:tetratricopeptide repeat-containing sulfotransferase family protein [Tropicimonas sediminicola]|uniref:Tetratricopeptide repeat-containing protein n=1 Tax=Tropicimonas sediminicola TaxID=1031541 RepID=A0A239JIK5_9RHOB|nr:sulfotransferase [Tropicimonas sediminicola]SNT05721.1 Tetratricopeptide repeat-containing protein [Tropicimonas sediminicola]
MLPLNPSRIPTEFKRAQDLQRSGEFEKAKAIYKAIADVAPRLTEVHFHLGRIAFDQGDTDGALAHLERARRLKPAEPAILSAMTAVLSSVGRDKDAITLYDDALATHPTAENLRIDRAFLLQRMGEIDRADRELRRVLKKSPLRGDVYRMLVVPKKVKADDPVIRMMEQAHADPRVKGANRVQLQFALAKAMEDTGQTKRVFTYLTPANRATKELYKYDVSERRDEVEALIDAFSGHDFTPSAPASEDFAPIFVTGLPRSGTTLVEQVLASHSQVTAAGEQSISPRLCFGVIGMPKTGFRPAAELSGTEIEGLGQAYQDAIRKAVAFDRVVTDKGIQSHLFMGLLKQAIPSARFVVVRRDPRDLLFSIYKNQFKPGTHRYAYDLEDLAAYYATFLRMLDFWREALPGGFHEISYEALVADPEAESRALVEAAGLEWEDACLEFHAAKREVKTLSIGQVRQPIYTTSARAWVKYETELAPLTAALEREGVL